MLTQITPLVVIIVHGAVDAGIGIVVRVGIIVFGEGVLEEARGIGLQARELNPGIIELGLGHGLGLGRSLVTDELGLIDEGVVAERVVGGDRIAIGIAVRRALKHGSVIGHKLTAGLILEVVHEDALEGRTKRDGNNHADGPHECRTNNESRKAHNGMHLH